MHISADVLIDALRGQGLPITGAGRAVCAVIAERHSQHLTAATILEATAREQDTKVDQSTVYSTLDALEDAGFVVHSHLGHGPPVFHLASETAHQHVVCTRCGKAASVPAEDLEAWVAALRSSTGFEVDPTHFAVTGLCPECSDRSDTDSP